MIRSFNWIRRDEEYFANHQKAHRLSCGHGWIDCSLCREKDLRVRCAGCPNSRVSYHNRSRSCGDRFHFRKFPATDTGEVLRNRHRRHCGQWHVFCDQTVKKGFQRTFAVDNRSAGEPSLVFEEGQELMRLVQRVWIGTCWFSSRKKIRQAPCLSTTPRDSVATLCPFMRVKRLEETIPVPAVAARSTSTAACPAMLHLSTMCGRGSTKSRTA